LKKWIAKLYHMVRTNGRKKTASLHIARTRLRSIDLMEQRAQEIEDGLVHYSPAVAKDIASGRE
jgi:hypothetical protein